MAESLDGRSQGSVSSSWVSEAWMGPGPGPGADLEEWHRRWACETRRDGGKQSFWYVWGNSISKVGPVTWAPAVFMRGRGPEHWQRDLNRQRALLGNLSPHLPTTAAQALGGNGCCYHPGFPPPPPRPPRNSPRRTRKLTEFLLD